MSPHVFALLVSLTAPEELGTAGFGWRDFIDTRVTFTIADYDLLKGPIGGGSPSSPTAFPGASNRLFFDDFERRDPGFENLTHLVLHAREPGFFARLDTEAALVLRLAVTGDRDVQLSEDGSFVRIAYEAWPATAEASADSGRPAATLLELTAFPLSADRFRLGYSYDISWGDSRIFGQRRPGGFDMSPGLRLAVSGPRYEAFLGWKTALTPMLQVNGTRPADAAHGILGGGSIDILDELRLEASGGFFHRGTLDRAELVVQDSDGRRSAPPWQAFGGSVQLSYHVGLPIGVPIDFRLYRNDPMFQQPFFAKEIYGGGISFLVQSEATALGQTLQDPAVPSATRAQLALAMDLSAIVKWGFARLHLLGVFRSLEFLLFNVPSLTPFVAIPEGLDTQPELFLALGGDYHFAALHFTPGLVLGVQRPAHASGMANAGAPFTAAQTVVVRSDSEADLLAPSERVELIYAAKLTFKLDLSSFLGAVGELQLTHDPNRRALRPDPSGALIPVSSQPWLVGLNLMLQARF